MFDFLLPFETKRKKIMEEKCEVTILSKRFYFAVSLEHFFKFGESIMLRRNKAKTVSLVQFLQSFYKSSSSLAWYFWNLTLPKVQSGNPLQ